MEQNNVIVEAIDDMERIVDDILTALGTLRGGLTVARKLSSGDLPVDMWQEVMEFFNHEN